MFRFFMALLGMVFLGLPVASAEPVTVFAAASLTDAMTEIGHAYGRETGKEARFSFASSATLARQIEAGAPADIYMSANERWMDALAEKGLIESGTRVSPLANRLVLIAPKEDLSGFPSDPPEVTADTDIAAMLGKDGRLAIGDPSHVPAGIYGAEALKSLGQWPALEHRLAQSDNVRAALALVARGEAPLGLVYATDAAISDKVAVVARFPQASHDPINYPIAILKGRVGPDARALYAFIIGEKGREIFYRYGFETVSTEGEAP